MAKSNTQITITKLQLYGTVLVALIGLAGTYLAGRGGPKEEHKSTVEVNVNNLVPATDATPVAHLPESTPADNYSVLKDISIFDLRSWKETPDSLRNKRRFSPVNYINYMHIKKLKDINKFTAHYATSGFAIDMRCITHKASILREDKSGVHEGQTRYAVEVDISEVPLNDEFLIVVEATYWNSYNNLLTESSSTYTDNEIDGLKELSLIIFLPEGKPFKSYQLRRQVHEREEELYTHNIGTVYPDETKRFIYWSVGSITADTHYKIQWDW